MLVSRNSDTSLIIRPTNEDPNAANLESDDRIKLFTLLMDRW